MFHVLIWSLTHRYFTKRVKFASSNCQLYVSFLCSHWNYLCSITLVECQCDYFYLLAVGKFNYFKPVIKPVPDGYPPFSFFLRARLFSQPCSSHSFFAPIYSCSQSSRQTHFHARLAMSVLHVAILSPSVRYHPFVYFLEQFTPLSVNYLCFL